MNKYIWTVLNSCIACLLINLHNIKLYNFILYKDNNPIFPAMPLNHTLHCHTTIGPLDPPIQTCAPPTRAITQSVISGPGMLWKSPTNTSEGIGIAEELEYIKYMYDWVILYSSVYWEVLLFMWIWYTNIFVRCIYDSVNFTDYTHMSTVQCRYNLGMILNFLQGSLWC